MAYNKDLEIRIDEALKVFPKDITGQLGKKKMFGGLAFLYRGKMTVGIVKEEMMVRVISVKMDKALKMAHVRSMDFTGRSMKEFIFVSPDGFRTEAQLQHWLELGIEHAESKLSQK
jgi:TfoX/Sxy family transcriptional regulator of competence genes